MYHLLLKHYPDEESSSQKFLMETNIFWKELHFYETFLPELVRFQKNYVATSTNKTSHDDLLGVIRPPFPEFFYGQAVNYNNFANDELKVCHDPLDNCIVLCDLPKSGGFQMANRLKEFDLDHCSLVIEAQAKLHALSWAYKKRSGLESLVEKFPFFHKSPFDVYGLPAYSQLMDDNTAAFCKAIKSVVQDPTEMATLLDTVDKARSKALDVISLYFCEGRGRFDSSTDKDNLLRVPGKVDENESQWTVALHGDSWINNFMFHYHRNDELSKSKPVEVNLIDLQLTLEGDPMIDLSNFIFGSTTSSFRQKHVNHMLQTYANTFTQICQGLNVPLPTGFGLNEIERRFHRAKIYGYVSCLMNLGLFLEHPRDPAADATEFDGTVKEKDSTKADESPQTTSIFNERVVDLIKELYAQGII